MESILSRLDRKMYLEKLKVVLSLDNATCFPETLQENLTNIKLVFLPKNKTSWLPPLDPGIIRSFKNKYRNLLVCYVVSRINEEKTVSQIIEDVHVLKAITWLQTGRKSTSTEKIKQCFIKCEFDAGDMTMINEELPTEFQELSAQITITSKPAVDPTLIDWQQACREKKHFKGLAIRRYRFNQWLGRRNCWWWTRC